MDAPDTRSLPKNAYLPLAPGEVYRPVVPAGAAMPETTWRSVGWGLFLCVIFTVASAYSGLKVGQVMEAAIPISILAIGLARVYARRSSLLENVIITGIGGVSGAVVAGAIFTLPALYILELDPHPAADDLHLPRGRLPRRAVPGPAAPLLRARDARAVPVPGGHRDHRGAGHGREGRLAGEAAATGDRDRGRLRLPRDHLPRLARVRGLPVRARDASSRGARAGGGLLRRRGVHPRPRLRDGAALVDDPVLGRVPLELRAGAAHLDDRPGMPEGATVYPATVPIAEMSAGQIYRGYVRFIGVGPSPPPASSGS